MEIYIYIYIYMCMYIYIYIFTKHTHTHRYLDNCCSLRIPVVKNWAMTASVTRRLLVARLFQGYIGSEFVPLLFSALRFPCFCHSGSLSLWFISQFSRDDWLSNIKFVVFLQDSSLRWTPRVAWSSSPIFRGFRTSENHIPWRIRMYAIYGVPFTINKNPSHVSIYTIRLDPMAICWGIQLRGRSPVCLDQRSQRR